MRKQIYYYQRNVVEKELYQLCHQLDCDVDTFYRLLKDIRGQLIQHLDQLELNEIEIGMPYPLFLNEEIIALASQRGDTSVDESKSSDENEMPALNLDLSWEECQLPHQLVEDLCLESTLDIKTCKYIRGRVYSYCKMMYRSVPFLKMPMLAAGLGGAHVLSSGIDKGNYRFDASNVRSEVVDQIYTSLKMGIRHIDTAEMYGNDFELKHALKRFYETTHYQREDIWITSKVYGNMADPIQACREIIERTGSQYLDLYLMHVPITFTYSAIPVRINETIGNRSLSDIWQDMQTLVAVGLVRYIGVSNFGISDLDELLSLPILTIPPYVNQIEYSIYLQQRDLYQYCLARGIKLAGFAIVSPLKRFKHGPADELLENLSAKYSNLHGRYIAPSAILIRHAQQKQYVAIVTASKESRMLEYEPVIPSLNDECHISLSINGIEALDEIGIYRHQRAYNTNNFPDESEVALIGIDDKDYYFGPDQYHVNEEFQNFVDSFQGRLSEKDLNVFAIVYYTKYYNPPPALTVGQEEPLHLQLEKNGYFLIRNVLSREQCYNMRQKIMDYIKKGGPFAHKKGLKYYIPDIRNIEELRHIFVAVDTHPKVQTALQDALNTSSYRLVERNEISVDAVSGWHRDNIEPKFVEEKIDPWSVDAETGDVYKVVNVAIYFQDHNNDNVDEYSGITIAQGSQVCERCHGPHVQPFLRAGDAVVFDCRLRHKGIEDRELIGQTNRIQMSFGYGVNDNVFSSAYEVAVRNRNRWYNNYTSVF